MTAVGTVPHQVAGLHGYLKPSCCYKILGRFKKMTITSRMPSAAAEKLHPEIVVDNFSSIDCDLTFYSLIRALCRRYNITDIVDYGAGRNRYAQDFDPMRDSYLLLDLRDLRHNGAQVTSADMAPEVLTHPTSHHQHVIDPTKALPFADASFDLIVSDYVFEHVEDPVTVAAELQRVLRPGGWMLVRTPNRFGYLKLAASIVPNRLHNAVLRSVQPHRKSVDTFPTFYRLNSRNQITEHFGECSVNAMTDSWEPAYFFGRVWVYKMFLAIHKFLPKGLGTASIFILQKRLPA